MQLAEVRASSERMAREKASAQAELAGLRERVECEGLSARRSVAGLGSIRAAEAIREAEVGREQAEARERSAQLNAERARRHWDLARQQLEVCFLNAEQTCSEDASGQCMQVSNRPEHLSGGLAWPVCH